MRTKRLAERGQSQLTIDTNRNQPSSVRPGLSGGTAIVSYVYDTAGNITTRTLDNGTSTAYTVDQMNRETAVVHSLVGGTKRFDYAYNNVSDITAVQRDSSLGDGYAYDLNQEVLGYAQNGTVNLGNGTVTNPQTNTTLTFDGCGNRTSKNAGGTYVTDSLNCPTTFDGQPLTYSPSGNLWTYNNWTFTYDAQNRLTNAFLPGSKGGPNTNLDFYYDAKNRQIARNVNGTITLSVWDDWELVEEYATGNVVSAKYLQGAHGPVKSLLNAVYFYQDSLGSTSHIASSTGTLLEYYKYDLYGKPKYYDSYNNQLSTSAVRDLFSGERWVPEMSMYDLRNRFYSPDLGRFLQPDPIGFKGDASNLYRYCGNDWASHTDPMGTASSGDPIRNEITEGNPDNYDPNHISGCGSGQFSKMQSMGAIQISQRMQAHSVEMKAQAEAGSAAGTGASTGSTRLGTAYLVYGGKWTEQDAKLFQQLWRENEKILTELAGDNIAHIITPDHAGGFNIVPLRRGSHWEEFKNWLTGAFAPAPERFAKNIARQIKKDIGHEARQEFHDMKQAGGPDRTRAQLKADARAVYENWGKTCPRWLQGD